VLAGQVWGFEKSIGGTCQGQVTAARPVFSKGVRTQPARSSRPRLEVPPTGIYSLGAVASLAASSGHHRAVHNSAPR
jgi:hypothetical protein